MQALLAAARAGEPGVRIPRGGRGIRTPGEFPHNGFQDRHIRPLCQPSMCVKRGIDSIRCELKRRLLENSMKFR